MLEQLTTWLLALAHKFFVAAWDFVGDLLVLLFDGLFGAIVSLVGAIPVPGSLAGGLQQFYASIPAGALYALDAVGVPQALAIVASGIALRLILRFATLFQWG